MYRHSLRQRVAIAFALCVAVLSVVWGFAFFAAIKLSEDSVLTQQLQRAVESYPNMPVNLHAYDNVASLPQSLKSWANTHPTEGIYEFEREELHVAVLPSDKGRNAFVVFDVAGIEAASSRDWWWLLVITGVVGTLGVLGFALGILVMRRAVAPVAQLAKRVADIDPEELSSDDHKRIESKQFGDDEVGMLANTIERTLGRISEFVERERYFTSSASHELRTPITVIMGAVEVLKQSQLTAADKEVLERIKRASVDMKTTVEMFLCLARELDDRQHDEEFLVMPIVTNAVEQQRHLQSRQFVNLKLEQRATPLLVGQPQAFSIVVMNLVRNAFEHTLNEEQPITVQVEANKLLIINQADSDNTKPPSPPTASSHGYGLGLGIVQRLCERNGWSFSLLVEQQRVTASLSW